MNSALQIVKNYQQSIWDSKDISVIEKYFHDDAIIHSPVKKTKGVGELKKIIKNWHIGFPNLKVYWDDYIVENNKVAARWHAKGCHKGSFLDLPPTTNNISYSGVTIYQLKDTKIIEYWAFVDMEHIKSQLGAS